MQTAYSVDILKLSNKRHHFSFEMDSSFFADFTTDLELDGHFKAEVTLNKSETMLVANMQIEGEAELECDRSLRKFMHPVKLEQIMYFKYGDTFDDSADDVVIIPHFHQYLELGQYFYDFIVLALPFKRLHPDLAGQEDDSDRETIPFYATGTAAESDDPKAEPNTDPRWEALKKIKPK